MTDFAGETAALTQRIARLEGRNRILGAGLAGLALLAGAAWSLVPARAANEEVRTTRLVLVDQTGATRAMLTVAEGVGPSLALYHDNGKLAGLLAVPSEGTTVAMYDKAGQMRLRLAALESTGPSLVLNDARRRARVQLSLVGEQPALILLNDSGAAVWRTP